MASYLHHLPFAGRRINSLLMVLLAIMGQSTADLTMIHEVGGGGHGRPWVGWGYSLLPSTFPLTWDEAREACEVIPGSMLARVEEWEGEAALAEYLKTVHMKDPIWLANRQTLPEVLLDEQREMHHLPGRLRDELPRDEDMNDDDFDDGGPMSLAGSDLTVGGDVGVTLRCSIYILGVGIVHELCSSRSVSAALCVQRLSTDRPLGAICPPSVHHTWLLVNRQADVTPSPKDEDTSVTITGLQQCHHHQLGQTYCHHKDGWSKVVCPSRSSQNPMLKHHKGKNHHKYHHGIGHGHLRQSHKGSFFFKGSGISNNAEMMPRKDRFLKMHSVGNHRSKRDTHQSISKYIKNREWDLLRLSPRPATDVSFHTKAQNLNLDLIESIMKDLSKPKKKKRKNKKPKKDRRNRPQGKDEETTEQPLVDEETTLSQQVITITPTNDNTKLEQHTSQNIKEQLPATTAVPTNIVPTRVIESTVNIDTSSANNREENEDDIATNNERMDVNKEIDKENSRPSITVGVGPIFVEDALPEAELIEVAVASEDSLKEPRMNEEIIIEASIAESPSQTNEIENQEIVFPEILAGITPGPTLHSNLETTNDVTSSIAATQETLNSGTHNKEIEELVQSESTDIPQTISFNEIVFPKDNSKEISVEASVAEAPTTESGAAPNVKPEDNKDEEIFEMPDTEGPHDSNEEEKHDVMDTTEGEKDNQNNEKDTDREEEKVTELETENTEGNNQANQVDQQHKEADDDLGDTETQDEENLEENISDTLSESQNMEQHETATEEKEEDTSKDVKENAENKDMKSTEDGDTKTVSNSAESDSQGEPSMTGESKETKEVSGSEGDGKHILLSQIIKGLFG